MTRAEGLLAPCEAPSRRGIRRIANKISGTGHHTPPRRLNRLLATYPEAMCARGLSALPRVRAALRPDTETGRRVLPEQ
ncbi:hypothetical protein IT41_10920 [Paracoccus halophilus]|uniref:Uncharacterized protein n=1 Tax=Paracoccus halophilus TaxID=376733 RepID=A0A099F1R2_9RHOB|nr:hypothetical protein IT41_10920 [Paracoccus halophilus]